MITQELELSGIQSFSKDIRKLLGRIDVFQHEFAVLYLSANETRTNINMFGPSMITRLLRERDAGLIIFLDHKWLLHFHS
jgi:hypothetical protein